MKLISLLILDFFDYFHKIKIINFLKLKKIKSLNTLFDVGAHRGESVKFFTKFIKIKKIYCFEPSPDNFKILKKNVNKYLDKKDTKVSFENIALGKQNSQKKLIQFKETSSSSLKEINYSSKYYKKKNFFLNTADNKMLNITQSKLKDYIIEKKINNFDLIKIDTEGNEYEVLLGLEEYLSYFKIIIFEHHYDDMIIKGYTFTNINNLLKKHNFFKAFKSKMPFRKTFEYIYINDKYI